MNAAHIAWLQRFIPDPRQLLLDGPEAAATLGMTYVEFHQRGVFREIPFIRFSEHSQRMWARRDIEAWAEQHGLDLLAIRESILGAVPESQETYAAKAEEEQVIEPLPNRDVSEENVYRALYDLQKGRCAICRTPHKARVAPLVIDHDHATGFVRGLLCTTCNTAIGQLQDRADLVRRAADYLTESPFAARQVAYRDMLRHRSRVVRPRRRKPKPSRGEFTA